MYRKYILVGDTTAAGGTVLPFTCHPSDSINGLQKALIGSHVFCTACNTVGWISKAGGPYRSTLCGAEHALEGDVVHCQCPVPSPLISSKQNFAQCDDRSGTGGYFDASCMHRDWYCPDEKALTSSKRMVDDFVTQPSVAEVEGRICPEMSDEKFCEMMLGLRDRAIKVIQRRENLLKTWEDSEKERVKVWFGIDDEEMRKFLQAGLAKVISALAAMTKKNFVRYTPDFGESLGCTPSSPVNQTAAVCRTDIKTRTIGFTRLFCVVAPISPGKDSKISTLIHEVTHFEDILDTYDHRYGFELSKKFSKSELHMVKSNADSYAGYICDGMIFPD